MEHESGEAMDPDEYLEDILGQLEGQDKDIEMYNRIRLLIRRYFKKRKCFVFLPPCGPKGKLETMSEKDLEPDFLKSVDEFSKFIYSREPLQLKSGRNIHGRMFANLALHYVSEISQHKQPSILEATRYMVAVENQTSIASACDLYKKQMQDNIAQLGDKIPADNVLVHFHERCMARALYFFKQAVLFDDEDIFKQEAMRACRYLLGQFKRTCDDNSTKSCNDALAKLNKRIERKLKNDAYSCKSGHDEYIKDLNWIKRKYTKITGLGSKARDVYQNYIDGKVEEEKLVQKLVLKAHKGEGDTQLLQRDLQHRPEQMHDLETKNSRPHSFSLTLKTKVDDIEQALNRELEEKFVDEKKNIKANYIMNVKMNLKELERQRSEAHIQSASFTHIEEDIHFFQKVLEFAMLKEGDDDISDANTTKESDTLDETDETVLGERPSIVGRSQATIKTKKSKQKQKSKRWGCKVQYMKDQSLHSTLC